MIRAGFHLSISGGVYNSATEAAGNNYKAFQLFVSNPRSWKSAQIPSKDAQKFAELLDGAIPFAHMPYLCNPSSPNPEIHSKSLIMLEANMENCKNLGVRHLVVHIGSHLGKGIEYGKGQAVETIGAALDKVDDVAILLENSSGYSNSVGSKLGEIGEILRGIESPRVGMCFDTCHAFAAGYDLRSKAGLDLLTSEIKKSIGSEKMHLVHLNDAKFGLGSGLDCHWHIGKGNIGTDGFRNLFSNDLFRSGSFVMETPVDEVADHKGDMLALESILSACGLKANRLDDEQAK